MHLEPFGLSVHAFAWTGQENIIPTCRSAGNYYIPTSNPLKKCHTLKIFYLLALSVNGNFQHAFWSRDQFMAFLIEVTNNNFGSLKHYYYYYYYYYYYSTIRISCAASDLIIGLELISRSLNLSLSLSLSVCLFLFLSLKLPCKICLK